MAEISHVGLAGEGSMSDWTSKTVSGGNAFGPVTIGSIWSTDVFHGHLGRRSQVTGLNGLVSWPLRFRAILVAILILFNNAMLLAVTLQPHLTQRPSK